MKLTLDLRTLFVAGGAALAVAAGTAYALIPGPGGVIQGCYKRSGGTLRVIDAAVEVCQANEIALPWSQTGPQGPAGTDGADGADGAPGISGYEVVSSSLDVGPSTFGGHSVACPTGKVPLGGGAGISDPDDDDASFFGHARIDMDFMFTGDDGSKGWKAAFSPRPEIASPRPFRVTVYATCAFVE
jgi:hypothetical protein